MNENLDLTKILKDCPKGTEFYSKCLGIVKFESIDDTLKCIIVKNQFETVFYKENGVYYYADKDAEIDLLPSKNQRDWSKWHRSFIDGDVIMHGYDQFAIFEKYINYPENDKLMRYYVYYDAKNEDLDIEGGQCCMQRLATEEEKQKLFQAIKDNGYKWNETTKTLEKLIVPKFKVGDIIRKKDGGNECVITKIYGDLYDYVTSKTYKSPCFIKRERGHFPIDRQDDYELIPDKFNPEFFNPFDKVLCRMNNDDIWGISLFERYAPTNPYPFFCIQDCFSQCVPYKDNTKHLVGTNNEAPEYYRYWED